MRHAISLLVEVCVLAVLAACGSNATTAASVPVVVGDAGTTYFGDSHTGHFWLGPVDFSESQWHNACAPSDVKYPALIQQLYGNDLMGLSNQLVLGSLAERGRHQARIFPRASRCG